MELYFTQLYIKLLSINKVILVNKRINNCIANITQYIYFNFIYKLKLQKKWCITTNEFN